MPRKNSAQVITMTGARRPPMTDVEALEWLRSQGSEVAVSQATMAEAIGWSRSKVGDRLRAWQAEGRIKSVPQGGRRASWIVTGGPDAVATVAPPVATEDAEPTVASEAPRAPAEAAAKDAAPVATTALPDPAPAPVRRWRLRLPLRSRPLPIPVATEAPVRDGRIAVNPMLANVVVNGLGIAAGGFFAVKGYEALGVSIHINTSYAESLAASETAKGFMRNAFAVVGYLAAFGAPAVETMLALGHRRAAIGAGLVTVCALGFGLHAAMGFVAQHTDATTKERAVFLAQIAAAESDANRAQDALDRIGVAAWSPADEDELKAKVKALPGGEKACTAAKPSVAVVSACQRITELREARSNVPKAEAARVQLTDASNRRKAVEAEAKTAGVTLGSDANPVSLKISEHVQAATGGAIPLTPKGVDVAGFFAEALAPELAVLACFWLSGVLLTGSCAALFRTRR